MVGQAIRLPSLASRAAARGELRSAAGRRIACPTKPTGFAGIRHRNSELRYSVWDKPPGLRHYHTRQALALTSGWPALQEYAFWNSGMF